MTDQTTRRILAEVAALRAEVAALRARRARRLAPALLLALLLAAAPLGLFAAGFHDLNPGSAHNANINLIADAGITRGCTDTQHYCPNDFVTREQMASFLARTAGLGGNPPVANAATVGGKGAGDLVRVARTVVPNNLLANPPQQAIDITAAFPAFQTVGTVTIVAPGPGFVLVTAQSLSVSGNQVALYARLRDTTSGEASPPLSQGVGVGVVNSPVDITLGSDLNAALTPTHVFPVAAAGTLTFALEVATTDPAPDRKHGLFDTTITALYLPFGYDGGANLAP